MCGWDAVRYNPDDLMESPWVSSEFWTYPASFERSGRSEDVTHPRLGYLIGGMVPLTIEKPSGYGSVGGPCTRCGLPREAMTSNVNADECPRLREGASLEGVSGAS